MHNNIVYNEYISHREHIHMNSTQWETLTDFTKWLGREGGVSHTHTQNQHDKTTAHLSQLKNLLELADSG